MRTRGRRTRAIASIAVAAVLGQGPASAAADITSGGPPPEVLSGAALFDAVSRDGRRVVFSSRRALVRGDRDRALDVYVRAGGRTTLLSPGGGAGDAAERVTFEGATPDAQTVLFRTEDRLVPEDDDDSWDLYRGGRLGLELVSVGPEDPEVSARVRFGAVSDDGSRVFFTTGEPLAPNDDDLNADVYEYRAGRTRLISIGPSAGAQFVAAAGDGSRVLFSTNVALTPSDTDGNREDIYENRNGAITLVSEGGGPDSCAEEFGLLPGCSIEKSLASADASRVFFQTVDRLLPRDRDTSRDVYAHGPTGLELISTGPADSHRADASLAAISADGLQAYFVSGETFGGLSGDRHCALFVRHAGRTSLASATRHGPVSIPGCEPDEVLVSDDGSTVVFAADGPTDDSSATIYRRSGQRTDVVVLTPPRAVHPFGGFLMDVSADGRRVAFLTTLSLVAADRDGGYDIYSRGPKGPRLHSLGPFGGNTPHFAPGALESDVFTQFGGASADGRRLFFSTHERLLRRDRNNDADLYESGPSGMKLVSTR